MIGSFTVLAQDFDITLHTAETGTQTHQARNSITFGPEYSYTPSGTFMTAEIVNPVVTGDISYTSVVDPESRTLNTSYMVGASSGNLSIDATGNANYTIPFDLPPGVSGLTPILALSYSSIAGSGVAGYGWSISGLSIISRSPKTYYYDATYKGVDLSSNDRFSLDGQRLLCVSGTYGANGSVYRTENDIFSKITCYTGSYGPDKFEVKTKSGLTYQYGYDNDADQTVDGFNETINWFVNKITDVYGNSIDFSYIKDEGVNYIGEISYGSNTVTFYYKQGDDNKNVYFRGKPIKQRLLLDKIEIKYYSSIVKKYVLNYNFVNSNYNGQSILNEVIEYGTGSGRYNSTAFFYQKPDAVSFVQVTNNTTDSYITYKSDLYTGDFNGDGKADFLCIPNAYASWTGYKMYYGNGNNNFNMAYQNTSFSFGNTDDIRILDINGDSKDDIVYETVSSGTSTFKYIVNNGNAFSSSTTICTLANGSETGISGKKQRKTDKQENDNELSKTDYNGDGINDIFINDASGNWKIYSMANSSGTLTSTLNLMAFGTISTLTSQTLSGDFDGDGKVDLWCFGDSEMKIYTFTGTTLSPIYSNRLIRKTNFYTLGDFNSDGKIDMFLYGASINGTENDWDEWEIHLSNGVSFEKQIIPQKKANLKDDYVRIGDFNGDGASDIMATSSDDSWDGSYYFISKNNGTDFYLHNLSTYPNVIQRFYVSDFNGDGRDDFLCTDGESPWWNGYQIYSSGNKNNILLTKIGNGLGYLSKITYQSIAENGAPYIRGTGASFPVTDFQGPLPVVISVIADNARGSQNTTNYAYQGMKIHRQGKGFLCMSKQTVTDVATNMITENNCSYNSTKFVPMLTSTVNKAGNTTLSTTTNTWTYGTPATGLIFPYISSSTKSNSITGQNVTNTFTYNTTNGNLTQIVTDYNNGFTETVANTYDTNTTYNWIGGRLASSTITYAKTGELSIARTKSYSYASDGKRRPYLVKYLEGSSWYSSVNYYYNSNGNVTQQYEYSSNGGAKSTNFTYDTDGIRVATVTDPMGHETDISYNTYGRLSSEEDYLGNINSHVHDSMGRTASNSLARGMTSTNVYGWGLTGGPSYAAYYIQHLNNDGSETKTWYDKLSREIRSDVRNFNGTYKYVVTEYNTKGQLYRVSEPGISVTPSQWNTHSYDTYGRITGITRPSGRNTTFTYSSSRVTETTGGKVSWKETNSMGLVTTAHDNGGDITYTYYPDGVVKTITNGTTVSSMEYNLLGAQTKLTDPSSGVVEYTWDAYGRLTSQKNARNQTTTYTYYADGRINSIAHPSGEGTDVYTYNTNEQLTGIGNSTTSVGRSFGYDSQGRVNSIEENIAGSNFSTTFTYDAKGRLSTRTHPSGITETYNYNSSGYLSSITTSGASYTITSMNARQQITGATYGSSLLGEFGFDDYGLPLHIKAKVGSVYMQDYRYSFNGVTGNLSSRNNSITGETNSESFTYDNLDRLTAINSSNGLTMGYDNHGNITGKSDLAPGIYTYGNSAKPYAVTEINSSNSLISSVDQNITYTSFDQPSVITELPYEATFTYNCNGQRAKMVVTENSNTILTRWYVDSHYEKETDGSITKEYTWIGGSAYTAPILAVKQGTGTTYYYLLRDHLGSITHVTNTAGTVLNRYSFDAWGRRRNPTNWGYSLTSQTDLLPDRGFTGHEYLPWFKLYNMNGRLYDPLVGRFLSADNSIQNPLNSQNYNRYSYCLNNPLKYTDPSGELYFLKQATESFRRHEGIDYSNHIGRGKHFNYDGDLVVPGGGGGAGSITYSYSMGLSYYYDSSGNLVMTDMSSGNTSSVDLSRGISRHSLEIGTRNGVIGAWVQTVTFSQPENNSYGTDEVLATVNVINTFIPGSATNSGGDGLKLNSTNTFIYDGQWKVDPLTHSMKAGQHVRVEVKNMNIFGVQLDLQDKTFYHYEKTWLGTKKQVYSGDSYTFMLLPYQTKTFDFYRFDYVPMNWTFELGTKISDAANVQIRFYSDWVPGMPYDPNHPNR
jgi:RHS repeat-associated protein